MSHNDGDRADEYPELPYLSELPEITTELLSVVPRRKTGVIVGVDRDVTHQQAGEIIDALKGRFPDVTLVVVAGARSVAFEWEVDE